MLSPWCMNKEKWNKSWAIKLDYELFLNTVIHQNSTKELTGNFLVTLIHSMHGLRMPNESFFHWNREFLRLDRQIEKINSRAFWVKLSAPILVQGVPVQFSGFLKKSESLVHVFQKTIYLGFILESKIVSNLICKEFLWFFLLIVPNSS